MKGERGNLREVIEGAKRISPGLGTKTTLGQEDPGFVRTLGDEVRKSAYLRKVVTLENELADLERQLKLTEAGEIVEHVEDDIEIKNEKRASQYLVQALQELSKQTPTLKKLIESARRQARRGLVKYVALPASLAMGAALTQHSPQEFYEMWKNWSERHIEKRNADDPEIKGIDQLYNDSSSVEKTTFDFLGEHYIDYKFGYYKTSVFDLTDKTPPQFKIINGQDFSTSLDSAAGITTNLFQRFYKFSEFKPELKGHTGKTEAEKMEMPVIGYNTKTRTMRAGHYREFNEDWLVSETYEIPLNFQINQDSTINLVFHPQATRMVPLTINEQGKEIPFPIGVTRDRQVTKMNPNEATRFGVLEGGKVIMVCGEKQLQVNGSFADMFKVYERLKKEYPNTPIQAYLLDNGSFNLPIWNKKQDSTLSVEDIRAHINRHRGGGTALVLMTDGAISPFEYRNKYREVQHYIGGATLDSTTGRKAVNEKSVVVIHHTGNYGNPNQIIREFSDSTLERSAHVLILKDGTRHLFNNDHDVLAHAGKSEFRGREKVNFFSLGIEMEGDTKGGRQFTLAQLESMLEYMRPRIEKYKIPIENITTHKEIRDNWFKKYPSGKDEEGNQVFRKQDLEERVWEQIRELITRKLYKQTEIKTDSNAQKMIGALTYGEAYRVASLKQQKSKIIEVQGGTLSYTETPKGFPSTEEYAMGQVREALSFYDVSEKQIGETVEWIKKAFT